MKLDDLNWIFKDKRAIAALNISIIILLAVAVMFLTRDIVSIAFLSKAKPSTIEKKLRPVIRHNFQDYAVILKNNPFGFQGGELTNLTSAAVTSAPTISPTDVVLIGTIAARSDLSYAIIADKTGQQDVYKVGDGVLGFGKLVKVEKNKVVINSNGSDVDIPLADIGFTEDTKAGSTGQAGALGKKTGDTSYLIDRARVQQAIDKPEQIMTDARFLPNVLDGKQQGFVLREVKPGGIYNNLGLQSGDVLLRINEINMSSPESALQAFSALRGIDKVQLDIIRNGAKMTMSYQIK
ncbi:MAG: PDZ domain-containing protein [Nitrospirae bacterium]|nr:PDZ domain-containing protein [Nitrospirota bacterium]